MFFYETKRQRVQFGTPVTQLLRQTEVGAYPGRCVEEHVGVKAPGREKTTARLPLKRASDATSFHVKGLEPPIFSSRTRHLKVTEGTLSPSFRTDMETEAMVRAAVRPMGLKAEALLSRREVAIILMTNAIVKTHVHAFVTSIRRARCLG